MYRRLFAPALTAALAMALALGAAAIPSAAQASTPPGGLATPTLTAQSSRDSVLYGHQALTFSGTLTAVPPGGGDAVPEAGIVVLYTPANGTPVPVGTTQSDGSYSGIIQNVQPGTVFLTTDATDTVAAAQSNGVTITAVVSPLTLNNIRFSPAKPTYRQVVTVTGTVDAAFSTTTAVPGAAVRLRVGTKRFPKVITNASGKFSVKFNTVLGGEDIELIANDSSPLVVQGFADTSLAVRWPLQSKFFKTKLKGTGFVASSICLQTSPLNFSQFAPNSVELQDARTPHGPWQKLGLLQAVEFAPKSCVGRWTSYNDAENLIPGRLISAYYRVIVPANATIESFRSKVVHSSILRSRVVSFDVSPRAVDQGEHLVFSGRLQRQSGRKWPTYAHQPIIILARFKNKKAESEVAKARTDSHGHFSVKLTAGAGKGRLVFAALFPGSNSHLFSVSRQITVSFNESDLEALTERGGLPSLLVLPQGGPADIVRSAPVLSTLRP